MTAEIVRLAPANAALLDRVAEDVFDEAIVPERLAAYLAEPGHLMFVALAGGEVVGQIAGVVHRHPDQATELYIDNLGGRRIINNQGIARRLIEALLDLGRELGCDEAWVATEPDNGPARNLYAAHAEVETVVMYAFDL